MLEYNSRPVVKLCYWLTAIAAVVGLPKAAHASAVSVSYSPTGLPSLSGQVMSLDLTGASLGAQSGYVVNPGADQVTIKTANGGAVVRGSVVGAYAAPVTGGTVANPDKFPTQYLSSSGAPGTVTLVFSEAQSYFGLLWGSIGTGDLLEFYRDGSEVASITGAEAIASAAGFNGTHGAQGYGGSQYTLVNLIGSMYDTVVLAQTGAPSFEAADIEYGVANQGVPVGEPGSLAVFGVSVAGLTVLGLRRRMPLL